MSDALERLFNSALESSEKESSLDEKLEALDNENTDDDFIGNMSQQSKDRLMSKFTPEEITLDEKLDEASEIDMEGIDREEKEITEEDLSSNDPDDDVLELNNTEEEEEEKPKRGRGRPPKKKETDTNNTFESNNLNIVLDMLVQDIINDLHESKYKIYNFNEKQMSTILDYMKQKF